MPDTSKIPNIMKYYEDIGDIPSADGSVVSTEEANKAKIEYEILYPNKKHKSVR